MKQVQVLVFVASLLQLAAIPNANASTQGAFFKEMLDSAKTKECLKFNGISQIDEEVFRCERTNECNYLGKLKGSSKYQMIEESNLRDSGKFCSIMEKVKTNEDIVVSPKNPSSCKEAFDNGMKQDGIYSINIKGNDVRVYCDMTTIGGGWTVFQRRESNLTSFDRNWLEYENGFGSIDGDFWLGLKTLRQMTSQGRFVLWIDLKDYRGIWGYAKYNDFYIDGSENQYRLHVGTFEGDVGDSLSTSNNMKFTTYDKDNDAHTTKNCAAAYSGGWWHNACFMANLNGLHYDAYPVPNTRLKKMSWYTWSDDMGTLTYSEMKFKAMT